MDENLQSKIRENLVARRASQFQWLAVLVKTPSENLAGGGHGDMSAISELTAKALSALEFGVERHTVIPETQGTSNGAAEITNLVVRHEFNAGPVVALPMAALSLVALEVIGASIRLARRSRMTSFMVSAPWQRRI